MGLLEDMVRKAEEDRARAEGREPDFESPAGIAGVVLNPGESVGSDYEEPTLYVSEPAPVAEEVVEPDDDTSDDDDDDA